MGPFMINNMGVLNTFWSFFALTSTGFIITLFWMKETKGLTDDECKTLYNKDK